MARSSGRRTTTSFGGRFASGVRYIEEQHGLIRRPNPFIDWAWSDLLNMSVHDPKVVEGSETLKSINLGWPHGFPYWDAIAFQGADQDALERIRSLRAAGVPILGATFGSFIGQTGIRVWREFATLAAELRATVCLIGAPAVERDALGRGDSVICTGFVPMSKFTPLSQVLLHHGGIGTMYACLISGTPSLVRPIAFDQSFNGSILEELGVGRRVAGTVDLSQQVRALLASEVQDRSASLAVSLRTPQESARRLAASIVTVAIAGREE